MDQSYQIITDANCDLPADLVEKLGLAVIPMPFMMDGTEVPDELTAKYRGPVRQTYEPDDGTA